MSKKLLAVMIGLFVVASHAHAWSPPKLYISPQKSMPIRIGMVPGAPSPMGSYESPLVLQGSPVCHCPWMKFPGTTMTYAALRAVVSVVSIPMMPQSQSLASASGAGSKETTQNYQVLVNPLPDFYMSTSFRPTKPVPVYATEVDPFFQDDVWTSMTPPSNMMYAMGPSAAAACAADATTSNANKPNDSLYYCAGSWGPLYPLTRNTASSSEPEQAAFLIGTKVLALMASRGMLWRSQGLGTECTDMGMPILVKSLVNYAVNWGPNVVIGKSTSLMGPLMSPYDEQLDLTLYMGMKRCVGA